MEGHLPSLTCPLDPGRALLKWSSRKSPWRDKEVVFPGSDVIKTQQGPKPFFSPYSEWNTWIHTLRLSFKH